MMMSSMQPMTASKAESAAEELEAEESVNTQTSQRLEVDLELQFAFEDL